MPMRIEGTYSFPAPPEQVWNLLMDPEALAACIPGCQRLEPLGDDRYQATLTVGVAGIRGTYTGTVGVAEKVPPHSYRLLIEGSGAPGFVKGSGLVRLVTQGEGTEVRVEGEAEVGGAIAAVGQRLLQPVARMLMNQFFTCMQKRLETVVKAG